MGTLKHLFDNYFRWASQIREKNPDLFSHSSSQQAPEYLWTGCSDSRVPANEIVDELSVYARVNSISSIEQLKENQGAS